MVSEAPELMVSVSPALTMTEDEAGADENVTPPEAPGLKVCVPANCTKFAGACAGKRNLVAAGTSSSDLTGAEDCELWGLLQLQPH